MPDPTVTEKPKPRRRRAKRPAADPTAPKRPRVTLRSRIEAMGPTHLAAYRTLANGNAAFVREVAAAFKADDESARAADAIIRARRAMDAAEVRLSAATDGAAKARAVLAKLDRLARTIAQERGDVPTDDATAPTVAPASDAD